MSKSILTLVLAGGEGERLSILSQVRAKPGVPFGGKYRIIDFALSNAVNSGLTDVAVLTQYAPRSLIDHIGVGRPWDLDRSRGGVTLLQPYLGRGRHARLVSRHGGRGAPERGVHRRPRPELVVILAGDHVYKMDYPPVHRAASGGERGHHLLGPHRADRGGASVRDPARPMPTGGSPPSPRSPRTRPRNLVSMGVYIFAWPYLRSVLSAGPGRLRAGRAARRGRGRPPRLLVPLRRLLAGRRHGRELLADEPRPALRSAGINLYDRGWLIYTKSEERAPALIGPEASVTRSMISHGCVIEGRVEHSILSPGVRVERGAVVRDSIVMFDTVVGEGAQRRPRHPGQGLRRRGREPDR